MALPVFAVGKGLTAAMTFVIEHWRGILLSLLIGLMMYQNFSAKQFLFGLDTIPSLQAENEALKAQVAVAATQLQVCADGNKTLTDAIDAQNKALQDLGGLTAKMDSEFKKLNETVNKIRKDTNKTVKDILDAPTPQTCEEAMQFLRDGVGDIKW